MFGMPMHLKRYGSPVETIQDGETGSRVRTGAVPESERFMGLIGKRIPLMYAVVEDLDCLAENSNTASGEKHNLR